MASLGIGLIILGCMAYQYQKGTTVRSFAALIAVICSGIAAFSYFEVVANIFISRSKDSDFASLVPWAQPLSFVLLFVLAFAILATIIAQLSKPVDLGLIPERIGRVICGFFLGLTLSGLLLTTLAMSPLPNKYPYQRFDADRPNAGKPKNTLLNADGFATGLFNMVSGGSLSGKRSFAVLHPDFLGQAFLNRHVIEEDMPIVTSSDMVELPKKDAVRVAGEALMEAGDLEKAVEEKRGHRLMVVRVGVKKKGIKKEIKFTPSQLRLICKAQDGLESIAQGKGINVYPIGHLTATDQLQRKNLNDVIKVKRTEIKGKRKVRWFNFAFYVPDNFVPTLLEFKQNTVLEVPRAKSGSLSTKETVESPAP